MFHSINQISYLFLLVLFGLVFSTCSSFQQNDFLKTIQLTEGSHPEVICKLYQTGIDNYRYEFKLVAEADTMELFDAFLNDAKATEKFIVEESPGKVMIKTTENMGTQSKKIDGIQYNLAHTE